MGQVTHPRRKAKQTSSRIWLSSEYRVSLIKDAIERAGSMNGLGRELGYRSRRHPGWSVRQILIGKQPITYDRLKRLANLTGQPMPKILEHQVTPNRVTPENTRHALESCGLLYYFPR